MAKELNSEFEIQARVQKAFLEATQEKGKNHQALNDDEIKVFFHSSNKGKGAALRTGFKKATGEICIVQDADLEYDPKEYNLMIGDSTAEKIKKEIGTAIPTNNNTYAVKGRDLRSGTPKEVNITEEDTAQALNDILKEKVNAINRMINEGFGKDIISLANFIIKLRAELEAQLDLKTEI